MFFDILLVKYHFSSINSHFTEYFCTHSHCQNKQGDLTRHVNIHDQVKIDGKGLGVINDVIYVYIGFRVFYVVKLVVCDFKFQLPGDRMRIYQKRTTHIFRHLSGNDVFNKYNNYRS